MIEFVLMVNKQGQTRLSSYYKWQGMHQRTALEAEVIRKCLSRNENQCSFMEHREYKIVYRRYASLYFIVGIDDSGDVSSTLVPPHTSFISTLTSYFSERTCHFRVYTLACGNF